MIVKGIPIFIYSKKLIFTLEEANSITIILAIDPKIVNLPAKVDAIDK
jgi:hypothetical protein